MPRKRASSGSGEQSQSKSAKTNNNNNEDPTPKPQPRSKRWTKTCVSANLDADYSGFVAKDRDAAFSFICFCPPGDDDDEEGTPLLSEDESEDNEDAGKPKTPCDNGKTCLCHKPAADHPEHPWTATEAGLRKLSNLHVHASIRLPDLFDLYIYNDFHGYGMVEVVQNLFLDFVEVGDDWKEQWAICEATAYFISHSAFMPMTQIDDGDRANDTYCLIGGMFLRMLATLESQGLLDPDSEVKNLGTIMAVFIKTTSDMRDYGISEDGGDDKDKITKFCNSDEYILAYAKKYNIELRGPDKIDGYVEDLDEVKLPKTAKDSWGWTAALKEYEKRYGANTKPKIGGNDYDITALSSAERKAKSFDKKDPLGKAEIGAIQQGLILQVA